MGAASACHSVLVWITLDPSAPLIASIGAADPKDTSECTGSIAQEPTT
jgi:hypothetical protein